MSSKRIGGLGRGLGSLIPQPVMVKTPDAAQDTVSKEAGASAAQAASAAPSADMVEAYYIPVASIDPNPLQPRKTFGHQELEDLMSSIREHGVLQPITVTRKAGGRYELVAGERRWRASTMVGLPTVPAVIRDAVTDKKLVLALIENVQRQDLNALEEAQAYQQLMDEYGFTQEDVSKQMGKARSTIANTLRLLGLPEEVKNALASGELAAGTARAILALPDDAARLAFFHKLRSEQGASTREVERRVRQAKGRDEDVRDPSVLAAEAELRDVFGTRVDIKKRHGQGTVTLSFYADEEYERVMGLLRKSGGQEVQ
jgi:ParB family chromosome partitioning protein